jgi:hypothetical protein
MRRGKRLLYLWYGWSEGGFEFAVSIGNVTLNTEIKKELLNEEILFEMLYSTRNFKKDNSMDMITSFLLRRR